METEEQKLLNIYKARRSVLTQEVDLLTELINLIDTRQILFGDPSDQKSVNNNLDDLSGLLKWKVINMNSNSIKSLNLYNPSMTYNEKITFALSKLGTATVHEISDFLQGYDHIETPSHLEKHFNGLTMAASGMNVRGEIYSQKQGRRNKYSLTPFFKEEPEEEESEDYMK